MKWIRAAFRGWGKLWNGYEDAMKYQPVAYEEAMKIPQNSENSYEVISWYFYRQWCLWNSYEGEPAS